MFWLRVRMNCRLCSAGCLPDAGMPNRHRPAADARRGLQAGLQASVRAACRGVAMIAAGFDWAVAAGRAGAGGLSGAR